MFGATYPLPRVLRACCGEDQNCDSKLSVVLCVGEMLAEREANETAEIVQSSLSPSSICSSLRIQSIGDGVSSWLYAPPSQ